MDPTSASLQITLVSLEYISQKLTKPMVDLDKFDRMRLKDRRMKLEDRLKQSPFTEYASFNWLVHFIDCEGVSGCKIFEAFQSAFDSKATFCWIEMCLTLDRNSFQRIRVGLEDIIEWADDAMQYAPGFVHQYKFLRNWCSTILCVVNEISHGPHPAEIHLLDFSETFRSNGLGETYNNHGHFAAREIKTFFDDQSPLRVQANTSPINPLQLRTARTGSLGLFIYDHTRHVFITAERQTETHREILHVQDVKTGRRLPPVIDPERFWGYIRSSTMSKDGKYLAIVYGYSSREGRIKTSIWQIDSELDFKKRTRSGSWASKVFSKELPSEACVDVSVVFGDDEYIYSPVGRVHLATSIVTPFPQIFLTGTNGILTQYFSTKGDFFVQQNEDRTVVRYSVQEPECREHYSTPKTRLREVSPTGRYLLLSHEDTSPSTWFLYDTTSNESFNVPRTDGRVFGDVFKFSADGNRLFYFSSSSCGMHERLKTLAMDLGGNTARVRSYGKCDAWIGDGIILSRNLSICHREEIAWLATAAGDFYPVDLSTPEIVFPKGLMENQDFPRHYSAISRDGMSLSVLHYGSSKAYIQKFNLNKPEQPARRLDLACNELKDGYDSIEFSHDASMLVCDMNLYHLPKEDQLPIPIAVEPILLGPRGQIGEGLATIVSIKNDEGPIVYVSRYGDDMPLSLYRVDLIIRSSVQLDIPRFNRVGTFSDLKFHPSLPLVLVGFYNSDKKKEDLILDLNDLNIRSVEITQGLHFLLT